MDLRLNGAACIVTGAGRGIGRAAARALCAEGARVVLSALEADELEETAAACRAAGGEAVVAPGDLTAPETPGALVDRCHAELGPVDVLVNCAGRVWYRSVPDLTDEDLYAQWELNVMALARLLRLVGPEMAARGAGRVVAVSSVSAKQPSAANVAYGATKTAQVALVRGFADAYAAQGVVINSLLPGPVDTALWRAGNAQMAAARGVDPEQIARDVAAALPRGKVAGEDEIAAVIAFLASPLAANVSGSAWTVDGGSARQLF